MAQERLPDHRPQPRQRRDGLHPADPMRLDTHLDRQRRRLPALPKPGNAQHHGEACRNDVDSHARDHLVARVAHTGQTVQPGQHDSHAHRGHQGQGRGARGRTGRTGGEGGKQHLALQADIDHARALGQKTGQRTQHQRRGHPHARAQHRGKHQLIHGQPPATKRAPGGPKAPPARSSSRPKKAPQSPGASPPCRG